jgi:hypothetical protein
MGTDAAWHTADQVTDYTHLPQQENRSGGELGPAIQHQRVERSLDLPGGVSQHGSGVVQVRCGQFGDQCHQLTNLLAVATAVYGVDRMLE